MIKAAAEEFQAWDIANAILRQNASVRHVASQVASYIHRDAAWAMWSRSALRALKSEKNVRFFSIQTYNV